MRTTLKRGIGRASAVNGNGRAVLPPPVSLPITRYRQPEPEPRTLAGWLVRVLVALLAAAVSVALAIGGGYYLFLNENTKALRPVDVNVIKASKTLNIPVAGKPTVALVVGYDHRLGAESKEPSRSDTIMLLRADPQQNTISMLSFPRDLEVENRCPGHSPFPDRINAAYAACGARGTLDTVRAITGLPINFLITVNFAGFKQIVSKVGGVWIDVDRRYLNKNIGTSETNFANINLLPGYQKLNGQDALDYVRYRHTDSDIYRLARQQQFVRALKEQVTHGFLPLKVPRIVKAITHDHNIQVGEGGNKQFNLNTLLSYALFAYRLPAGHLFQAHIDNLTGTNTLAATSTDIANAVEDFRNPDVQAPAKATAVALGRKLKIRTGPRPQSVPILVLNGNGRGGAAGNGGYLLAQRGYHVVTSATGSGNAPNFAYFHTQVYFDPRLAGSRLAAVSVAKLFVDGVVSGPIPPTMKAQQNGAMLIVVVGQTFDNQLAPAPRDQTPKREPAYVRGDPASALPLLRARKARVPFRLELPAVTERASQLDSELPARLYWIGTHKAIRLTYKTSLDVAGYWGIEETDWNDAPVLQQPNEHHWFKGRRFDLYYSGPHLHMVVLRENGASYWVVNTLLDKLSNETMLAIARGLRPLPR